MAALAAVVAAFAAGCGGAPAQTTGTPAQTTGAPPHSATSGLTVGAQRKALATRYLAIAVAGNRRLEAEFGRLHKQDRVHLAAAHRDLREIAATERLFDRRLLGIPFPPATKRIAQFLYWVNEARASMTVAAASSPSLARLRAGERRLNEANKPVEQAVTIIRSQLGLPPPETS